MFLVYFKILILNLIFKRNNENIYSKLWYSRHNVNLINLIFTWDCFLMYLLKIHVDLCQLNQCILDWNLKNNNTKTQYKVVWKQIPFLFIYDAYFKQNEKLHIEKNLNKVGKENLSWTQMTSLFPYNEQTWV